MTKRQTWPFCKAQKCAWPNYKAITALLTTHHHDRGAHRASALTDPLGLAAST